MKNKKILNITLAVLPLIAVVLAGMPNSVTVYQITGADIALSCSFFTLIEDVNTGICLPYAGIFGGLCFGLAVIYLVSKKRSMLKWIFGTAFVSVTLSVVPVLLKGDVILLPNMLIPVLLGVEALLAYGMMKAPVEKDEEPKGKRLENR